MCCGHFGIPDNVRAETPNINNMFKVGNQFVSVWETLLPLPGRPCSGIGVRVLWDFSVNTGAGVAIPIPGTSVSWPIPTMTLLGALPDATWAITSFDNLRRKSRFAELVQQKDAAEPGSNDDGVVLFFAK